VYDFNRETLVSKIKYLGPCQIIVALCSGLLCSVLEIGMYSIAVDSK